MGTRVVASIWHSRDGYNNMKIAELSPCKTKSKHKQKNKNKRNKKQKQKPARPVVSWSVHGQWKVQEEMITLYHLRDWYGNVKQSETTNHKVPYKNLWARKQQLHNAETKAPPSQEPRDHRVQAARATFSQIHVQTSHHDEQLLPENQLRIANTCTLYIYIYIHVYTCMILSFLLSCHQLCIS